MKNKLFILSLFAAVLSGYSVNAYAEDKIENFDDCNPNINPDCKIVASKTEKTDNSK